MSMHSSAGRRREYRNTVAASPFARRAGGPDAISLVDNRSEAARFSRLQHAADVSPRLSGFSLPVQRVKDTSQRQLIDARMDELRQQTRGILSFLKQQGEDWEKLYGAKGKEKARGKAQDLMSGKKSDYAKEIRREVIKRYWASLTPEEKLETVAEAGRLLSKAAVLFARAGVEAASVPRSSGTSKGRTRREPSERSSGGSGMTPGIGWISALTADDLETLYDVYKARKKVRSKIEKLQERVVEDAGNVGESVGAAVGRTRAEYEFIRRCEERRQDFMTARLRYFDLEEQIAQNEDTSRYQSEMGALLDALININGPAMVYYLGALNEAGRQRYPQLCAIADSNLAQAGFKRKTASRLGRAYVAVKEKIAGAFGRRDLVAEAAALANAQTEMAAEVHRVAGKSWRKYTSYGWTPTGVKKIRKEMPTDTAPADQLAWVKAVAAESAATKSKHRSPETRVFYDAIANMEPTDLLSLRLSLSILQGIGEKLG